MYRTASPSMSNLRGEIRAYTDAVRRLDHEFHGNVHHDVIRTVVRQSLHEIECPSPGALPELVERLARVRLLEHVSRF